MHTCWCLLCMSSLSVVHRMAESLTYNRLFASPSMLAGMTEIVQVTWPALPLLLHCRQRQRGAGVLQMT